MLDHAAGAYPSGWDVEWVAVDRRGRVGVFTTGAVGPVPRGYLDPQSALDRIREAVWEMPERTGSALLVQLPRPDDYEALARRGLFAYDWCDVHRTSGKSGLYELQARPVVPICYEELEWPAELRPLLGRLRSAALDFERQTAVDVREFDCVWGP